MSKIWIELPFNEWVYVDVNSKTSFGLIKCIGIPLPEVTSTHRLFATSARTYSGWAFLSCNVKTVETAKREIETYLEGRVLYD